MKFCLGLSENFCKIFSYQFKDYSKYAVNDSTAEYKKKVLEEKSPQDLQKAFELGKKLVKKFLGGIFMNEKIIEGLQTIVTQLSQQADGHLIQSRIFAAQGLSKLAKNYEEHAEEERSYVVKCIDRIIDLGGEIKLEDKKSAPIIKDAEEFLKYDLQVSKDGLKWLSELVKNAQCDLTTFGILAEYYKDEEKDMYETEQQLELINLIGKQNWLAKQI